MRNFINQSKMNDGNLALALAPALTPRGLEDNPNFFRGFAAYPQVLSRGLLVLSEVTATRYFNYVPTTQRDPVLSAQGDRLRAECFSACNGVYARLDLLQTGFDGEIGFGTTNVDIGLELRSALTGIRQKDKLHVTIGGDGFTAVPVMHTAETIAHLGTAIHERPVQMPNRWIRGLGNAAQIHQAMKLVFTLSGPAAQVFVSSLPPATGKNQSGWLVPTRTGVKVTPRQMPGAVYLSGFHRLSSLKRLMTNITAISFYMPEDGEPGPGMVIAEIPGARLTLSLTAEAWQGYSGEGALLASLASQELLSDAAAIGSSLSFHAMIDEPVIAGQYQLSRKRTEAALALLAVSGKLGFDAYTGSYFHRELPDDPDRVLKDNPRLAAAQKLTDVVSYAGDNQWLVHSNGTDYRVSARPGQGLAEAKCTCTWYLKHLNKRGPCKHILAVQLKEDQ